MDYIIEENHLVLTDGEKRYLETEVYLAQHDIWREEKEAHHNKMIDSGYVKLTDLVVQQALDDNKNIQLVAEITNDWMTTKVDKTLKPKLFDGIYGLLPLKARTHGYSLAQFKDAYCKLV